MVTLVEVRETFTDPQSGLPRRGSVRFSPSAGRVVDTATGNVLLGGPVTARLSASGVLSVRLPASDDPSLSPTGFTYSVREQFIGGSTYSITVPLASAASGVELSSAVAVPVLADSSQAAFVESVVRLSGTHVNVRRYGRDTAAITAARAAAEPGQALYFPADSYQHVGDLDTSVDGIAIRGDGDRTHLAFTNGGLIVNGAAGYTTEVGLESLRISRTGTAGPALRLKGGGAATGVAHFNASHVRVSQSSGECLLVDGSYIGTFMGCYFVGGATGIKVAADSVTGLVYGNNLSFFGGETQGCVVAASLDNPIGVNFYGHAFEGCTTSGVELPGGAYGVGFYGCYFEANAGWDLKVGTTSMCYNIAVKGCIFLDGTANKTDSVQAVRARALGIEDCTFNGYGGRPVTINEPGAGLVQGHVRNCWDGTGGDLVTLNGATLFNRSFLGHFGSTGIQRHLSASGVLDFGSIASHTHADLTMTVTGAALGDDVSVHTTNLDTGLAPPYGWVSAADTVTVRLVNYTAAAVDPAARTFRVRVWR